MARYDWPVRKRGADTASARVEFLGRLRPRADPLAAPASPPAGATPKATRSTRSRGAVAHTMPVGTSDLWFPIGPTVMTNGQAGGNPNVAGRVIDVQIEPTTGQRLYAAAAGGGVWLSINGGQTWSPLDDFQESDFSNVLAVASALSCGAIGVDWGAAADGSDDVVWVGTGEPHLAYGGLQGYELDHNLPGANLTGIGLLRRDPAVSAGAWGIVKGDTRRSTPTPCAGPASSGSRPTR